MSIVDTYKGADVIEKRKEAVCAVTADGIRWEL